MEYNNPPRAHQLQGRMYRILFCCHWTLRKGLLQSSPDTTRCESTWKSTTPRFQVFPDDPVMTTVYTLLRRGERVKPVCHVQEHTIGNVEFTEYPFVATGRCGKAILFFRYDKFRDHHAEVSLIDPVMTAVYTLLRRSERAKPVHEVNEQLVFQLC